MRAPRHHPIIPPGAVAAEPVDFRNPTRFNQDVQRMLTRGADLFCRGAANRLTALLGVACEVEFHAVRQSLYGPELSAAVERGELFATLTLAPLGSHALLTFPAAFVLASIDHLLGGHDPAPPALQREGNFTDIELRVAHLMAEEVTAGLASTWGDAVGVTLQLDNLTTNPAAAQIASPAEPSLLLAFEVRYAAMSNTLHLVLPYQSVAPLLDRDEASDTPRPSSDKKLGDVLGQVPLPTRAEVAGLELTLAELLELRPGSLVPLRAPVHRPVTLWAGQLPIHHARIAVQGTRRVAQVIETLRWPGPDHGRRRRYLRSPAEDIAPARAPIPTDCMRLEHLAGASLMCWVEIGRSPLGVAELVRLQPGQLVVLNKSADDPAELYVSGHRYAYGQLAEYRGQWAIQVTELT